MTEEKKDTKKCSGKKNIKKVDNSRGALSKQAFLEYFLSINTSSRKV